VRDFFFQWWSLAAISFHPNFFGGHGSKDMLPKKTISTLRAQQIFAALHRLISSTAAEAAWAAPCKTKNHNPLFIHYDSATNDPMHWSTSEAEIEYAVHWDFSRISI
jgi:hypothetical protein